MIKVFQDKFGLGGNCQQAVIASILELPLNDVPHFGEGLGDDNPISSEEKDRIFNQRIDDWLEPQGLKLQWYLDSDVIQRYIREDFKDTYYQVCGKSPRGYNHVVIYLNGEMVHDPHPEGGGVIDAPEEGKPLCFGFIIRSWTLWYDPNCPEYIYKRMENGDLYLNGDKIVQDTWCENLVEYVCKV